MAGLSSSKVGRGEIGEALCLVQLSTTVIKSYFISHELIRKRIMINFCIPASCLKHDMQLVAIDALAIEAHCCIKQM